MDSLKSNGKSTGGVLDQTPFKSKLVREIYASVRSREVCSIAELWQQSWMWLNNRYWNRISMRNFHWKACRDSCIEILILDGTKSKSATPCNFWMLLRHAWDFCECCQAAAQPNTDSRHVAIFMHINRNAVVCLSRCCSLFYRHFFFLSPRDKKTALDVLCAHLMWFMYDDSAGLWDAGRTVCSLLTFLLPFAASTSHIFWHFTFPMCHVSPIDEVAFRTRFHFSQHFAFMSFFVFRYLPWSSHMQWNWYYLV